MYLGLLLPPVFQRSYSARSLLLGTFEGLEWALTTSMLGYLDQQNVHTSDLEEGLKVGHRYHQDYCPVRSVALLC